MTHINYPNDNLTAKGRNYLIKQLGICISPTVAAINLLPISSRGVSYSCIMDIPYDRQICEQIISAIHKALDEHEAEKGKYIKNQNKKGNA